VVSSLCLTDGKENPMPTATLSSKGQITVPKEIRERLGLTKGDRLEFVFDASGSVRLRPLVGSVRELAGILRRPGCRPVSIEEMDEAIGDFHAAEDQRIRDGK
jgi:AbrB family looped-hinge helix DNA binding protein